MSKQTSAQQSWLLVIAVITLAILPLVFVRGDYNGADSKAEGVIKELNPTYQPWASHLFEPPSSEVASLLFASQAALGAGVLGFVIGLYRGRSERRHNDTAD
jgi:cobalt/nickel transport protein